jgi:hypothetical protein
MKNITLELTEDDVKNVLAALGEIPAKFSIEIILKIREQYQKQSIPAQESKKAEEMPKRSS